MKKKNNEKAHLVIMEKPLSEKNKRQSMISVRGAFSESIGIKVCVMQMQLEEFDKRTRMIISNHLRALLEFFFEKVGGYNQQIQYKDNYGHNIGDYDFCIYILSDIFCQKIDLDEGYSYKWRVIFDMIHEIIINAVYNEVLDIIWVVCNWLFENYYSYTESIDKIIYDSMNELFEKEYVGYRFVNGKIVAITDKTEIEEIEEACNNPFDCCRTHIQKAVGFLADREKKDYKNCIKESISAVEAVSKVIAEKDNAELKEALKVLKDKGLVVHGALEKAFLALYGYASDEGGIRHSERLFESSVTFEEAKFMLVSCSAFVNYLIAEVGKVKGKIKCD